MLIFAHIEPIADTNISEHAHMNKFGRRAGSPEVSRGV